MMGYHLADTLRKEQPQLPLIFITGVFKGGKHAIEARQKYAAAGYFEKPFEAQQAARGGGQAGAAEQKAPPARPRAEDAFEVELDIDVEEEEPPGRDGADRPHQGDGRRQPHRRDPRRQPHAPARCSKVPGHAGAHAPAPGRPPDPLPAGAGEPGMRRGELQGQPALADHRLLPVARDGRAGRAARQGEEGRLLREAARRCSRSPTCWRTASASSWCAWGRSSPSSSQDAAAVATQTQAAHRRRAGGARAAQGHRAAVLRGPAGEGHHLLALRLGGGHLRDELQGEGAPPSPSSWTCTRPTSSSAASRSSTSPSG